MLLTELANHGIVYSFDVMDNPVDGDITNTGSLEVVK